MSAVMLALFQRLPRRERYPLPPALITDGVLRTVREHRGATITASHFAYGAATGALYPLVAARSGGSVAGGAIFGIALWTASYLGWIPLAGLMPPATKEPARRNALMLAAHVVWGMSLALAFRRSKERA